MHWIGLLIAGLVIGILAKLLMPGKDPGGFIITTLLGIAGMYLGAWIAGMFGIRIGGVWAEYIIGLVGAIILLFIYRLVARKA